jgi:hypothetical protein
MTAPKPRPLTAAQWRLLVELDEPTTNPEECWYFPQKNLRTLQSLASFGLAQAVESDLRRYGYRITESGKMQLHAAGRGWRSP